MIPAPIMYYHMALSRANSGITLLCCSPAVNQEWREVGATCGTSSAVDWNTYTIAAEACTVTGPQPSTVVLPQSLVTCSGNPCTNAVCLSNPLAVCILNFCGNCLPQWHLNGTLVQCSGQLFTEVFGGGGGG